MAKYLLKTEETYRVDTEEEAKNLIEKAKNDNAGDLIKYNCEYRSKSSKGEIIDEWYRVILKREFNKEAEPISDIPITYRTEENSYESF